MNALSVTDVLGSTIEASHYAVERPRVFGPARVPRVVVEIANDAEIVNAHLTIDQARRLLANLELTIAAAETASARLPETTSTTSTEGTAHP